ncbi:MAG: hypothetical protein DRP87_10110 [Spirochaetes bacterium]|nr:MAG: hypothetical protein DRP87_10110 [Spirochaetota bacterium]
MLEQDLHIHTTFSTGDSSIVPEQTVDLIARYPHARIIGISDHLEYVLDNRFDVYKEAVCSKGFYLGIEIGGGKWVSIAVELPVDYYIFHCKDNSDDYRGLELLIETGKPVIVAHPFIMGTNLKKVPSGSIIEINNRYIWRTSRYRELAEYKGRFDFILSSDAHQPNWLSQHIARSIALELSIEEKLLFPEKS